MTVFTEDCHGMSSEEPVIWVIPADKKESPEEETGEDDEKTQAEKDNEAEEIEAARFWEFQKIAEEVDEYRENNFTFPVIILESGFDQGKVNEYLKGHVTKEESLIYMVSEEVVKVLRENDVRDNPDARLEASFEKDIHCYMLTPLIHSHKFFTLLYLVTICVWGYHHLIKYRSTLTLLHRIVFFVPVFKLLY